jgi:hypothetical protein
MTVAHQGNDTREGTPIITLIVTTRTKEEHTIGTPEQGITLPIAITIRLLIEATPLYNRNMKLFSWRSRKLNQFLHQ